MELSPTSEHWQGEAKDGENCAILKLYTPRFKIDAVSCEGIRAAVCFLSGECISDVIRVILVMAKVIREDFFTHT